MRRSDYDRCTIQFRLSIRRRMAGAAWRIWHPIVARVAQEGDAVAISILAEAGRGLAAMVTTIIRRLSIAAETFAVVPFGSVFKAGDLIVSPFWDEVTAVAPRASVVFPRYESVIGTLLLALAQGERDTATIWAQVEAEASGLARVLVGM